MLDQGPSHARPRPSTERLFDNVHLVRKILGIVNDWKDPALDAGGMHAGALIFSLLVLT